MPSTPWTRTFRRRELPKPTTTNAKDFADSVNARVAMPTKPLLDKTRDCSKYFVDTDVAETFAKARNAAGSPARPGLRRAK